VIISVNQENQKKDILLTHVAYVLGFSTNLFVLGRCQRSGIHFDSGYNILYKEKISNVIANLAYSHGHWLLDAKKADCPPQHKLLSMGVSCWAISYTLKVCDQCPDNTSGSSRL
jgi:hypothetical protein